MRNPRRVALLAATAFLALLTLGQQSLEPRVNLSHLRLNALLTDARDTRAPVDLRAGTTIGGSPIGGGGGVSDGDKGDITVSGGGATWLVDALAVAFSDLSGSATDAQIPNTITIDLATTATTANAGDSATAFFSSGAVEAARLDTAMATDAEVAAGYQPLDTDLTNLAGIVNTAHGRGLLDDADAAASRTSISAQASDTDLDDLADGSLTGSKVGTGIDAGNVSAGVLAGARGGIGQALPTCAGTDKLTSNGTIASCATDQTSAGGGITTVEDIDSSPTYGSLTKLSFDQADGFAITNPVSTEAQIDLSVADGAIANSAVDGGAGGEIEDGTITADDLATGVDPHPTVTLGPFYINDLAGTATTQATLGFFNTATALSRNANADVKIQAAAHVVGLFVTADAARTAGTATARVRIAGTGTTFNSGAVALDATNTISDSSMVAHSSGNVVASGNTIGCDVVTSGWTPTTADIACWVVVSYD